MSLTPLQRINRILAFYYKRGINKESVNKVQRNILKAKLEQKKHLIELMNMKDSKYYENQFKPKSYEK
jgi:hypothetical protein